MSEVKGKVLKHDEQTRAMHWVHLIAFTILAFTGIGFYFDIGFINNIFGGSANASIVHRWAGVIFTIGPVFYIILNFERFARFIDTITRITKDDIGWLKTMGGYIPFLKGDVPPQDKYNAGQKMLGIMIIICCLLIILSGFVMWLWRHLVPAVFMAFCYSLHFWVALLLVLLVSGHFFLAAIHPKSRVEFASMMMDGYIDADISAHHNKKWFEDLQEVSQ